LAGIYIHVPFCKQACHYCDFHFSTSLNFRDPLLKALKTELQLQQDYLIDPISTIYFGGGTPSLLTDKEIEGILFTIFELYQTNESVEITLEANPDDLTIDYLKSLHRVGINRLSIGIQSFQAPVLQWMNRAHNSKQAIQCLEISRSAGFNNISIDLIYGVPLPEHNLHADLMKAVDLQPEHISAYNLTIEPKTVFGHQLKKGTLREVSEEEAVRCFELTMSTMKANGYLHYEISNFSLSGKESQHNTGYWNGHHYLGIGPSAHSFNGKTRQSNLANNRRYQQKINNGVIPFSLEVLTSAQRINELIMLGLRTCKGVALKLHIDAFEWDLVTQSGEYLEKLIDNEFAWVEKDRLILTDKGKLIADGIAEDLFIIE